MEVTGDTMIPVTIYNSTGSLSLAINAERVDIKISREPYEYKRKEVKKVNDRGFMTMVFVVTGTYKGTSEADATSYLSNLQTVAKTWYRGNALMKFVYRCGNGTNSVLGYPCWNVTMKALDVQEQADFPNTIEWVMTLMEAQ